MPTSTAKEKPREAEPSIALDAADLEALLLLARAQTRAEAEAQAARLRALLGESASCLEPHIEALIERTTELRRLARLATTDPLTGVGNRRAFNQALRRELARTQRSGMPLTVLLLDVDAFKAINDRFGHPVGDQALRLVSRCIQQATRRGDLVARVGGDEFALMLPETGVQEGRVIGERIRAALADSRELPVPVQVSIGLALAETSSFSATGLLSAADMALYDDKAQRKSRSPIDAR